jgi:Uma2 family endonuclease
MKIEKVSEPSAAKYYPRYKYSDYEKWEGHWELIDGYPYAMVPTPGWDHQQVSQKIASQLVEKLKSCKSCTASLPVDWIISEDTVVQPDNMVVCYKPEGKFLTKPPGIIFEIISPSSRMKDREVKYQLYESQGVKCYIIVDKDERAADIFVLEGKRYKKLTSVRNETITLEANGCKFDFDFSVIWEE